MKRVIKRILLVIGLLVLIVIVHFFVVKKLDTNIMESKLFADIPERPGNPVELPSLFLDSARFFLKLPLLENDTVLAYCDTGGGFSMILPKVTEREHLAMHVRTGLLKGVMPFDYVLFDDIVTDSTLPRPYPMRNFIIRSPFAPVKKSFLMIPPMDGELKMVSEKMPQMDAFLGQGFFMGKSWTIDYLNQKIWTNTPLETSDSSNPDVQKIGLKKNEHGSIIFGHPSMQISVDDESIDVLFDTGASFVLSDNGKKVLDTQVGTMAGSFIASSIFDEWKNKHPDWKIYPGSDLDRDIIEVPLVRVGSHEVGPVLFARRKDEVWSESMIYSMDKVVKGASGGSLLKNFKVTIDYNTQLIKFDVAPAVTNDSIPGTGTIE
nr:hypothetical protein [uncultured Allomuricauda sp.]